MFEGIGEIFPSFSFFLALSLQSLSSLFGSEERMKGEKK